MNSTRLAVQRTAPVGIPLTAAGRARRDFRAHQPRLAPALTALHNAAEAAARTSWAQADPAALDPTGRLSAVQAALAADDLPQAASLLDALLTDYLAPRAGDDESDAPPAHRPRRKRMSRMAYLLAIMALH